MNNVPDGMNTQEEEDWEAVGWNGVSLLIYREKKCQRTYARLLRLSCRVRR